MHTYYYYFPLQKWAENQGEYSSQGHWIEKEHGGAHRGVGPGSAAALIVYIEGRRRRRVAGWLACLLACLNLQPCGRNLGRLQQEKKKKKKQQQKKKKSIYMYPAAGSCPGQAATQIWTPPPLCIFSLSFLWRPPPHVKLRRCEWRVWFRGQTASKPFVHGASSYALRKLSGSPKEKTYFQRMKRRCL